MGSKTAAQVVQGVKTDYVYDKDDVWKWFITSCRWGSSITWLHNSICSKKGESAVSHLKRMGRLSELLPSPSERDSNSYQHDQVDLWLDAIGVYSRSIHAIHASIIKT